MGHGHLRGRAIARGTASGGTMAVARRWTLGADRNAGQPVRPRRVAVRRHDRHGTQTMARFVTEWRPTILVRIPAGAFIPRLVRPRRGGGHRRPFAICGATDHDGHARPSGRPVPLPPPMGRHAAVRLLGDVGCVRVVGRPVSSRCGDVLAAVSSGGVAATTVRGSSPRFRSHSWLERRSPPRRRSSLLASVPGGAGPRCPGSIAAPSGITLTRFSTGRGGAARRPGLQCASLGLVVRARHPLRRGLFADSRIELIPAAAWSDYLKVSVGDAHWSEILDTWQVSVVVVSAKDQAALVTLVSSDSRWQAVYRDSDGLVAVRRAP